MIKNTLQIAADAWGMAVKRYEITEITPDKQISEAMDKQAAAERVRRCVGKEGQEVVYRNGEGAHGEGEKPENGSIFYVSIDFFKCFLCTGRAGQNPEIVLSWGRTTCH